VSRFTQTITLRRRSRIVLWWQRKRRYQYIAVMTSHRTHIAALLVPYRFRRVHHWVATRRHYFWIPCPLCGHEFGGHEWRAIGGRISSIPTPGSTSGSRGICPRCTRAGRGVDTFAGWETP
jgi:hypothetical protein